MRNHLNNVTLAYDFNDYCKNTLKEANFDFLADNATINMVHVLPYSDLFSLNNFSMEAYPTNDYLKKVREEAEYRMMMDGNSIFGEEKYPHKNFQIKAITLRGVDVVDDLIRHLKSHPQDLLITVTEGLYGLKSLLSYHITDGLIKFSPCEVLVLRGKEKKKAS